MNRSREITNVLSSVGSVLGIAITLQDIYTILGIIITVLNISIVLYNLVYKIIQRVKNEEYDKIDDDIKDSVDDLNNIKNGGDKDEK